MSNDQLTLSKAFSASKVAVVELWLCVAEWCIILNSLRVLLDEFLPLINPVWSGWIMDGIIFSNLWESALVIIFMSTLRSEMGW